MAVYRMYTSSVTFIQLLISLQLEGLFTVLVAIIFLAVFPKEPGHPISFVGLNIFNERETQIIVQRVLRDDPTKEKKTVNITKAEILAALGNWKVYPHLLCTLTALATNTTFSQYAPTLVSSFGFAKLRSNALVSVGSWIQVVLSVLVGYISDRTSQRGLLMLIPLIFYWGFSIGDRVLVESKDHGARYAMLVLTMSVVFIWHPINGSWLALNARSSGERSILMAMFIMAANASGIIGGQLFQAKDKPLYKTGWTVIVALASVGVVLCIFANLQYRVLNRGMDKEEENGEREPGQKRYAV